jgi:hypothetical protein
VTHLTLVALLALVLGGCFGPREILARGQAYYEDNEYERALAVWRELERHEPVLGTAERARYAYLRGMTDYRLGFRDDARHWLAMAKVTEQRHPGSLAPAWLTRLDGALGDLDRETFGIRAEGGDPVQSIEAQPALIPEAIPLEEAPPEPPPTVESPATAPADSSEPED